MIEQSTLAFIPKWTIQIHILKEARDKIVATVASKTIVDTRISNPPGVTSKVFGKFWYALNIFNEARGKTLATVADRARGSCDRSGACSEVRSAPAREKYLYKQVQ